MAHYAWSNIRTHHPEKGRINVKPGTEVNAEMLGLDRHSFKELIEAGSVRKEPWPEGLNPDNPSGPSPNQHRLQQLRERREAVEAEVNSSGSREANKEQANN